MAYSKDSPLEIFEKKIDEMDANLKHIASKVGDIYDGGKTLKGLVKNRSDALALQNLVGSYREVQSFAKNDEIVAKLDSNHAEKLLKITKAMNFFISMKR